MEKIFNLYDRQIVQSRRRTLTDQIFDILCEEIHAGRWSIGDRLPSIGELAEHSGLSRMPVQEAFRRLEDIGYIRCRERVGAFLASMMPEGRVSTGAIGILLMADEDAVDTSQLITAHARVHRIMEAAVERGYQIETVYLRKNDNWAAADKIGGPFSERVKGIISLGLYTRPFSSRLAEDSIPLVFWSAPTGEHFPCVYGDHFYGMRLLMQRVFEAGHRKIVFAAADRHDTVERGLAYLRGYQEAMAEAGLPVDREAIERFRKISSGNLPAIREALEGLDSATAVVCDSISRLQDIVAVADLSGIGIPQDLSVVGPCGPLRAHVREQLAVGIAYSGTAIIDACFHSLEQQMRTRRCLVMQTIVAPLIRGKAGLGPAPEMALSDSFSTEAKA